MGIKNEAPKAATAFRASFFADIRLLKRICVIFNLGEYFFNLREQEWYSTRENEGGL